MKPMDSVTASLMADAKSNTTELSNTSEVFNGLKAHFAAYRAGEFTSDQMCSVLDDARGSFRAEAAGVTTISAAHRAIYAEVRAEAARDEPLRKAIEARIAWERSLG
jgi:hypothetical protein